MLSILMRLRESAGLPLEKVAGSQTAVFAGAMFRDYHDVLMRDAENLPRYHVTGNSGAFTANRLSHFFDLRGPSVSVDTACSTTLAALHLACQSLRSGESDMAVVGGANLMLHPGSSMSLSNLG
ncbi:thiolase-like protein [Xylariales sp. AK1849]|nr:thiolase-like protein [Xylariales sp. AK1849]